MGDPHFHDGWSEIRLRPEPEVIAVPAKRPTIRVVETYSDNTHPTRVAKRPAAPSESCPGCVYA